MLALPGVLFDIRHGRSRSFVRPVLILAMTCMANRAGHSHMAALGGRKLNIRPARNVSQGPWAD